MVLGIVEDNAKLNRLVIRRYGAIKVHTFKIDLRSLKMETRQVRDGNAMHLEGRTNIINRDESIEEGEWQRTITIPNYGDCFDKKPTLWKRIFGA